MVVQVVVVTVVRAVGVVVRVVATNLVDASPGCVPGESR